MVLLRTAANLHDFASWAEPVETKEAIRRFSLDARALPHLEFVQRWPTPGTRSYIDVFHDPKSGLDASVTIEHFGSASQARSGMLVILASLMQPAKRLPANASGAVGDVAFHAGAKAPAFIVFTRHNLVVQVRNLTKAEHDIGPLARSVDAQIIALASAK
jgi:hypothetical protein